MMEGWGGGGLGGEMMPTGVWVLGAGDANVCVW